MWSEVKYDVNKASGKPLVAVLHAAGYFASLVNDVSTYDVALGSEKSRH